MKKAEAIKLLTGKKNDWSIDIVFIQIDNNVIQILIIMWTIAS